MIQAVIGADGVVVNIIVVTEGRPVVPPDGCTLVAVPDGTIASIGDRYDQATAAFLPASEPAP